MVSSGGLSDSRIITSAFLRDGGHSRLTSATIIMNEPLPLLSSHKFQDYTKQHKMKLLSWCTASLVVASTAAFLPTKMVASSPSAINMVATAEDNYIDEDRRNLMNLILAGSAALTVGSLSIPYFAFFLPPTIGGSDGANIPVKDADGMELATREYLASHQAGDRSLVQGLAGDATYLIVKDDGNGLEPFALNAICTHLGCIVPWSAVNKKFICPCHGSQYDSNGAVVRGPAPLPLALAHVSNDDESGKIVVSRWTETDFRTSEKGWWNQ